jgi:WD40 repeat protein
MKLLCFTFSRQKAIMDRISVTLVLCFVILIGSGVTFAQEERTGVQIIFEPSGTVYHPNVRTFGLVPSGWIGSSPRYEIRVTTALVTVGECNYAGVNGTGGGTLVQAHTDVQVTVTDLATSHLVGSQTFEGSTPGPCPETAVFSQGETSRTITGDVPDAASVGFLPWLSGLTGMPLPEQMTLAVMAHPVEVTGTSFSQNGRFLTTFGGNSAWIWDATTHQQLRQLADLPAAVSSAGFSPDGNLLALAIEESVQVWEVNTGSKVFDLIGHTNRVTSVSFSPDGSAILTTSEDNTIRLWNAADGTERASFKSDKSGFAMPIGNACFSPDGQSIMTVNGPGTVEFWYFNGTRQSELNLYVTNPVSRASYSPDGHYVVTVGKDDHLEVLIWDLTSGQIVNQLTGHEGPVNSAVYSPGGRYILTAGADGTARIWDAATAEEVRILGGHMKSVTSASYAPDGSTIVTVSEDKMAMVWDAAETADAPPPVETTVQEAAPVPPASLPQSATLLQTLPDFGRVHYSPDGRSLLVTRLSEALVYDALVYDLETGTTLFELGPAQRVDYSPDGKSLLTLDGTTVYVWDAATGSERLHFDVFAFFAIKHVSFSPDSRFIITVESSIFTLWDAATGAQLPRSFSADLGQVDGVDFSPDGSTLVVTGWDTYFSKSSLFFFNVDDLTLITSVEVGEAQLHSVHYSPDGKTLVIAGTDRTARILDATTYQEQAVLVGHTNEVYDAVYSPDGSFVLTISFDRTAGVWDPTTGDLLFQITNEDMSFDTISFSPDGRTVILSGQPATMWSLNPTN